jgi:hypothetical protein
VKLELRAITNSQDCSGDLLDDAVDEIFLLGITGHVLERQYRDRWLVGQRERCFCWNVRGDRDAIDAHWPSDVLDLLLAQILKAEIDFVADLVADDAADADPARLGQSFQPCRDIDAVAVNILLVDDDIAEIDADAEFDAALFGNTVIAQGQLALQLDSAAHRVDGAGELDQEPVAGGLHDAAAMLGDLGVRHLAAKRRHCRVRAFFILAHQPGVARDVGRQYRCQPPLDALSPGIHGRDATAISRFTIATERVAVAFSSVTRYISTRYAQMENDMAEPAERMKMMRARRRRQGLRELRLVVPDARSEAVRNRIAAQVAKLNPDSERDALLWIEAVSEFDADEPR